VHRGSTDATALIDAQVPDGREGCFSNLRSVVLAEENGAIYANVVFDSLLSEVEGACPDTTIATATLTMATPIGDRPLVLNQTAWAPEGTGYRRCDPTLGCTPPADHCAVQWVDQATKELDIPAHSGRHGEYCDQSWMVMTIDVNTAACGAGGRPSCSASPSIARYFFRFETAWLVVTRTREGGCAPVLAAAPDFPRSICENLPAIG